MSRWLLAAKSMVRTFFLDFYENLNVYLSEWQMDFLTFKIIGAVLSLWFLFLIIIIMKRLWILLAIPKEIGISEKEIIEKRDKITKEWERIMGTLKKGDEANLKMAIIEADKLLDEILQKANFPGKDMGERLENINSAQISYIDEIWRAHKIRNRIAHEPNFKLTIQEAEEAIKNYQKALEELQVL